MTSKIAAIAAIDESVHIWRDCRVASMAASTNMVENAVIIMRGATPAELVYRIGFNPLHTRIFKGKAQ